MGKLVDRPKWLGGPTGTERALASSYCGECRDRSEEASPKETLSELSSPSCEPAILCEDIRVFSTLCQGHASSCVSCSKTWGAGKRVTSSVGGDWRRKLGGRRENAHLGHSPREEVSQEKLRRQQSTRRVRAASERLRFLLRRLRKKSSYWTNKQKISNAQRAPDEKPLLLSLNSHSWNSVTSY